jgi:hypothetical protein
MGLGLSSLRLGIGANSAAEPDAFGVTFTGLTDGEARVGGHASIGYTTDPVSATETVKWSSSSNSAGAATYGTGESPTDYTAGDGGNLWLHVTDNGETVSRAAPIRRAPAVNTVAPVLSGGTGFGDTLSFTDGTWTGAVAGSYARVLQRNTGAGWVDLPGLTHVIDPETDSAAQFRAPVSYTNSGGTVEAISNVVTADTAVAPQFTVNPAGTLNGRVLTVTTGTATGDPAPEYTISMTVSDGETTSSVTPFEDADAWDYEAPPSGPDLTIAWTVTASNTEGETSVSGSVVVSSNLSAPAISGLPTIEGVARVGEVLTAVLAPVTGNPTPNPSYQWRKDGVNITGAEGLTYQIDPADEGDTITFRQTATNSQDSDTAESTATATIGAAVTPSITFNAALAGTSSAPIVNFTDFATENTTEPFDIFIATHASGILTAPEVIAGTDAAILEAFTFEDADGLFTGRELTVTEAMTNGRISVVYRDSTTPTAVVSEVVLLTGVDITIAATTWQAPTVDEVGNGNALLSAGGNASSAPSAPTIDAVGDGSVTLNAA